MLGGTEEVVTVYLAIFSVAVAVGSGLAAWMAAGRIVILPTLVGAVLLAVFAIDLGCTTYGAAAGADAFRRRRGVLLAARHPRADRSRRPRDRRRPLHRADIRGGAGLGRRRPPRPRHRRGQRTNAAFMVAARSWWRCCRRSASTTPMLFILIGLATLAVAVVDRAHHAGETADATFSPSCFVRSPRRGQGPGEPAQAGPNPIIALNHVSFLDAALAMSLLGKDPVFAIDVGISQQWWVKPFLRFTRAHAARSHASRWRSAR